MRSGDITVDCVDTSLNTSDLGAKFLPRWRFEELISMMPLRLGIGLLSISGVDGRGIDNRSSDSSDIKFSISVSTLAILALAFAFVVGYVAGQVLAAEATTTTPRRTEDIVIARDNEDKTKIVKHEGDLNDFDIRLRAHLEGYPGIELQSLCMREGFSPGRATRECMILALLQKMSFESVA